MPKSYIRLTTFLFSKKKCRKKKKRKAVRMLHPLVLTVCVINSKYMNVSFLFPPLCGFSAWGGGFFLSPWYINSRNSTSTKLSSKIKQSTKHFQNIQKKNIFNTPPLRVSAKGGFFFSLFGTSTRGLPPLPQCVYESPCSAYIVTIFFYFFLFVPPHNIFGSKKCVPVKYAGKRFIFHFWVRLSTESAIGLGSSHKRFFFFFFFNLLLHGLCVVAHNNAFIFY